jgi:transcriptional regulator with XRE-family HTH domain
VASDAENYVLKFGQLVREKREERGWSQEALSAAAFAGSTNKGYISRIESGKVPNITRATVRNVARALGIDPEQIPPALRWPEGAEVVKDTNKVALQIQDQLGKLIAALEDRPREFGIKEGMLIALARRYSEGSPGDFDSALAGLERALEVARDERNRGVLPSNISEAVSAVIARIDAFNETGDLEAGQEALDAELAAFDDEDERRRAARDRLYEKGIVQAILSRSVENACRFVVAQFDLNAPADPGERYKLFRVVFVEWYQRGEEQGLNFDLEVAIALAREAIRRAGNIGHLAAMRTNLGFALQTLGERESGSARLKEAVAIHRAALEEVSRERVPLDWAATQNGLGSALWTLGQRESGTARLAALIHREL